jgi:hypothetical protein
MIISLAWLSINRFIDRISKINKIKLTITGNRLSHLFSDSFNNTQVIFRVGFILFNHNENISKIPLHRFLRKIPRL